DTRRVENGIYLTKFIGKFGGLTACVFVVQHHFHVMVFPLEGGLKITVAMVQHQNSKLIDRLFNQRASNSFTNVLSPNSKERHQESIASSEQELFYCTVRNIPASMRSSDLRRYFSDYTENEKFHCFHFRHRPELQIKGCTGLWSNLSSNCITFSRSEFIRDFNGRHWVNSEGMEIPRRCFVNAIKIAKDGEGTSDSLTYADLRQMIELRPPMVMPKGNVGTSTQYFMEQIRLCRLPVSLISKLCLKTTRRKRKYGSVAFNYTPEASNRDSFDNSNSAYYSYKKDAMESWHDEDPSQDQELTDPTEKILRTGYGPDNDDGPDDDDDQCEEWERHEALHDDVTEQDRIKPRKYEEEMEIVWEKGGPGLVWYTDKNFWDEREKGTDCDWAWADDWDVDYSVYYEGKSAGAKDARDAIEMRKDEARRSGKLEESVFTKKAGENQSTRRRRSSDTDVTNVEQYTKGIGSRLLGRMGWKPGSGLGRMQQGRVDPVAIRLEEDGQTSFEKKGFGYHGEKLQRTGFKKIPKIHAIASSFDEVTDTLTTPCKRVGDQASGDILFRRPELTKMKYRHDFMAPVKK
ncbi:g-patch domain protein, partial [Dictyocaulus viviparus]